MMSCNNVLAWLVTVGLKLSILVLFYKCDLKATKERLCAQLFMSTS
jgi:hypothetical protein